MFDINGLKGATKLTASELNAIHLGMGSHSDVTLQKPESSKKQSKAEPKQEERPHKTLAEIAAERSRLKSEEAETKKQ